MISTKEYRRAYRDQLHGLLHPPISEGRFWLAQALIAVAVLVHIGADYTYHLGTLSEPGFLWIFLIFVPVVYAGSVYGLSGSIGIALEGVIVGVSEELFLDHTTNQLWGAWSILFMMVVTAVLVGDRFEEKLSNQALLVATEHQETASYYEGHPLFREHLLEMLPDGVALVDNQGVVRYVNSRFQNLTGFGTLELVGSPFQTLITSRVNTDSSMWFALVHAMDSQSFDSEGNFTIICKDQSELPVSISLARYSLENEPWVIAMVRDDTSRRAAEQAHFETEQRFQLAFDNNLAGMAVTDLHRRILAVNSSFCEMLGRGREELVGQSFAQFTFPQDRSISEKLSAKVLAGEASEAIYTKRYCHKDGHIVWAEVTKSLARNEAGEPQYFISSTRDVTEERLLLDELSHQALHDPLTGLANRALFEDRLVQAFARAARAETWLAVFVIDLDEFKDVNDTFGHQVGDDLLVAVARRLEKMTRSSDTLCRFGGDEFLYLGEGLSSPSEAETMAARLLSVFDEPFGVGEENLNQTASIGLATCMGGDSGADLLRDADIALYDVKRQSKNHYRLFHQDMYDRVSRRVGLVQELRKSLESDRLSMYYQPIVNLSTYETVGFEALMRWNHSERGWVSPRVFIPLAEQSNLIFDLGSLAFRQAVSETASWQHLPDRECQPYVTVNLSPRQFHDSDLIKRINEALEANGLPANRLVLEITEGAAFADIDSATRVASRLRSLGVALAIDDFGTGYSSLSYFALLRPRILKIDQSFVNRAHDTPNGERLLEAIVIIGNSLDATVVAEGIETVAQLKMLRNLGYKFGQGFLFSPAIPPVDLANMIAKVPVSFSVQQLLL